MPQTRLEAMPQTRSQATPRRRAKPQERRNAHGYADGDGDEPLMAHSEDVHDLAALEAEVEDLQRDLDEGEDPFAYAPDIETDIGARIVEMKTDLEESQQAEKSAQA